MGKPISENAIDVAVREVKEMFHFRMAVQPNYGGALTFR
jgi:hypothetical protein